MDRKLGIAVAVAILIGCGLWLRTYFAPENVIKRTFLSAVASFENEEILGATTIIDRSYRDEYGQSYESLAGYMRVLHETYDGLEMTLEPPLIQVQGDQARMKIQFVLWGSAEGQRGFILGSVQAPCSAFLEWKKQTQGWRIVSTIEPRIPELQDRIDRMRQSN
ncbi:MAG: hypothetical protein GY906_18445 [bacterium]|nr:hypothetical protein [bacterium]